MTGIKHMVTKIQIPFKYGKWFCICAGYSVSAVLSLHSGWNIGRTGRNPQASFRLFLRAVSSIFKGEKRRKKNGFYFILEKNKKNGKK